MKMDDLADALSLSVTEGWNQTTDDWHFLLDNPENICIVAEIDRKVIGTATALVHSGKVAWIGMVLVNRSCRGMGIGRLLMNDIIRNLDISLNIKLDATPAGKPLYESLGFKDECQIIRMTAATVSMPGESYYNNVYETGKELLQKLVEYDKPVFGASREKVLAYLINNCFDRAFHSVTDDRIGGYVLGRKGSRFGYIGPLNADSPHIAQALLENVLHTMNGSAAAVDIHADKTALIELLEKAGFVRQREFTRMYLNKNEFPGDISKQFLISGPEFG